jgi:tetratricopeptide (TPR) repeat protein
MSFETEAESEPLTPDQEDELRRVACAKDADELADLDLAQSKEDRFYALPDAARAAVRLGKHEVARQLAAELLALAPSYKGNWNYGNAIHHAHTALGLVALSKGEVAEATQHLLAAGATPGAPQLDTFGPSMELARALMRAGQFETVAEYLRSCRVFWKMGGRWLDVWSDMVSRKAVPNCVLHAYR